MPLARHDLSNATRSNGTQSFYSHASCEAWQTTYYRTWSAGKFLLTCLLRGMTWNGWTLRPRTSVSTHMPLARHDAFCSASAVAFLTFLLTCLLRGMTTDCMAQDTLVKVSTHMPLARHDQPTGQINHLIHRFYSHASCEAWHLVDPIDKRPPGFYSHASCEAWRQNTLSDWTCQGFYSHASCEAWRKFYKPLRFQPGFYSHASCEAWPSYLPIQHPVKLFLLTCLLRGMTSVTIDKMNTIEFLLTCLLRGMTHYLFPRYEAHRFLLTCLLRGMTW